MTDQVTVRVFLVPFALIVGSFLLGLLFEALILARLRRAAAKTSWDGAEVIVGALHGPTVLWFVIAGFYVAVLNIPINQQLFGILKAFLLGATILSVTVVLANIAVGFVNLYGDRAEGVVPSTSIFANLTRLLIFIIGSLIILQSFGISITPLLTALGVGGLAVALALQETLSNLFAGVQILASKQIKPGDYVELDSGSGGYVSDINWRNTTITKIRNNVIVVPNSKLASAIVTNYSLPEKELGVVVELGVSYGSDLEKVERVTLEVANEVMQQVDGAIPDFDPFVRYHTFNDFSIDFMVMLRSKEFIDHYRVKHEFIKRLKRRYREESIEIPFPIRTVYLKERT